MPFMTLSAERKQSGLPQTPSTAEFYRTTRFAPFLKQPTCPVTRSPEHVHLDAARGEVVYTGKDISAAHAHVREQGLNDGHFDRFLNHFREALKEVGRRA